MKRNLIIVFLLFLALFIITGCNNVDYEFNKESTNSVVIEFGKEIEKVTITGTNYKKTVNSNSSSIVGKTILSLSNSLLGDAFEGTYELQIEGEGTTKTYRIAVKGYNSSCSNLSNGEFFNVNSDKYFVIYTLEDCNPCKTIEEDIERFIDYCNSRNNIAKIPVYKLVNDKSVQRTESSPGNHVGYNSNLQITDNARTATPTLYLVEGGVITTHRTGATNVRTYMEAYIESQLEADVSTVTYQGLDLTYKVDFVPTSVILSGPNTLIDLTDKVENRNLTLNKEVIDLTYNGTYQIRFYRQNNIQFLYLNISGLEDYTNIVTATNEVPEYDKEKPTSLEFTLQSDAITKVIINGMNSSLVVTDFTSDVTVSNGAGSSKVTFSENFFIDFLVGNYSVRLYNDNEYSEYTIKVSNYKEYNYLTKEAIFDVEENAYFVLLTRDNCPYCIDVAPYVNNYFEFSEKVGALKLYVIDTNKQVSGTVDVDTFVGIDNSADFVAAKTKTPTLLVIRDGKIEAEYTSAAAIMLYLFNNKVSYCHTNYVK